MFIINSINKRVSIRSTILTLAGSIEIAKFNIRIEPTFAIFEIAAGTNLRIKTANKMNKMIPPAIKRTFATKFVFVVIKNLK